MIVSSSKSRNFIVLALAFTISYIKHGCSETYKIVIRKSCRCDAFMFVKYFTYRLLPEQSHVTRELRACILKYKRNKICNINRQTWCSLNSLRPKSHCPSTLCPRCCIPTLLSSVWTTFPSPTNFSLFLKQCSFHCGILSILVYHYPGKRLPGKQKLPYYTIT